MKHTPLEDLKEQYEAIEIPEELNEVVNRALDTAKRRKPYRNNWIKIVGASAAGIAILTVGINANPMFAETLSEIPVLKNIVKVLTFKNYTVKKDKSNAKIDIPKISGLENKELEKKINEELIAEGEKTYQEFLKESEEWKDVDSAATLQINFNYEVINDTEDIFVFKVVKTEAITAGHFETKFYVVDKKKQNIVSLSTLFKDDQYVKLIPDEVVNQLKQEMEKDQNKVYWVNEGDLNEPITIAPDQKFYINKEGKLVIYFNKYEIAPGFMGEVEVVIPTEAIQGILTKTAFIK